MSAWLISGLRRTAGKRATTPSRTCAGLYKQLTELQALLDEFREDPAANAALREPIVSTLNSAGLDRDCPLHCAALDGARLTGDNAAAVPAAEFTEYAGRLHRCVRRRRPLVCRRGDQPCEHPRVLRVARSCVPLRIG